MIGQISVPSRKEWRWTHTKSHTRIRNIQLYLILLDVKWLNFILVYSMDLQSVTNLKSIKIV